MTDLMIIAVSVAVSLVADIAILIKKDFAPKKGVENNQKSINKINEKLSELEKQVKSFPRNNACNSTDYTEFKNSILILTNQLNSLKAEVNNYTSLKDKINNIENNLSRINNEIHNISSIGSTVFDSSELESKISILNSEITKLKTTIYANDTQSQLVQAVRQLSNEVVSLKQTVSSQQKIIDSLKNSTVDTVPASSIKTKTPVITTPIQRPVYKTDSSNVITPNEEYVKSLLQNTSEIRGNLGEWEFKNYYDGLKKILNQGDFDDGEEIMSSIHELIKKYIYGSDTKVSATDWDILEKYIINAGYIPVPVKAGDDISPFKSYFERPISANGGIPNTIKQIQLKPFVLMYDDCGEKEEIKLCGKCTYYK